MKILKYALLGLVGMLAACNDEEDPPAPGGPASEMITSITEDRTLSADGDWTFDGLVYVENDAVLTVEAGTKLKFTAAPSTGDNASALIITRGAKIEAKGTAAAHAQMIYPSERTNTERQIIEKNLISSVVSAIADQ